eukprot:m.253338 g.253338  ORF g.253338 m.253338 type:complete len:497 (+) comp18279_c0_seq1:246-1736(+)
MRRATRTWLGVLVLCAMAAILLLPHICLRVQSAPELETPDREPTSSKAGGHVGPPRHPGVTIAIIDFEDFRNELARTAAHAAERRCEVVVITDHAIYPPLPSVPGLTIAHTAYDAAAPGRSLDPVAAIGTTHVLVMPDNALLPDTGLDEVADLLDELKDKSVDGLVLRIGASTEPCQGLVMDVKRWTLDLGNSPPDGLCPYMDGDVALLLPVQALVHAAWTLRPASMSLFVQAHLANLTLALSRAQLGQGPPMFTDDHAVGKKVSADRRRKRALMKALGIKLVSRGPDSEWHGCSRESARCFGTVVNDSPEYIAANRWTPPCCLDHLRETARHVFEILDRDGVRYWLEGGSLLGAARDGDIIPWDYDVDVGLDEEDIARCKPLAAAARDGRHEEAGFVWEKAREGDFYRVQYSAANHLHVDLFPFHDDGTGTMTKMTWIESHRQDMPFPAHYLRPLARMPFVGMSVSVPNHHREFLELKFGPGVIENPRYPGRTRD